MRTINRRYPPKADAEMRRVFDYLYDLIGAQGGSAGLGVTDTQLNRLLAQVKTETQRQATQLLGAFAQPLVGDTSSDPLLQSVAQAPGTGTVVSVSVTGDPSNGLNSSGSPITGSGTIAVTFGASLNVSTSYKIGTNQVVAARKTGWGSPAGTLSRAAYTSYAGQTVSAGYIQAEVQAIDDAVKALAQRVAALLTDLHSATSGHGLIGT